MKKYVFGEYIIGAEPERTKAYYKNEKPYFAKCTCPACQNFFKNAKEREESFSVYTEMLGIDWEKPRKVDALYSKNEKVYYAVYYKFYGKMCKAQKLYTVEKNDLGSIRIENRNALFEIDDKMSLAFLKSQKNTLMLRMYAELPWSMETLDCFYDETVKTPEKRLPSRGRRILSAAGAIRRKIKS